MAQFFRGQRVRIVGDYGVQPWAAGKEAIFLHYGPVAGTRFGGNEDCCIEITGVQSSAVGGCWAARSSALAPLTDPSAERFIESIKKLGREPINDAPKVEVTK